MFLSTAIPYGQVEMSLINIVDDTSYLSRFAQGTNAQSFRIFPGLINIHLMEDAQWLHDADREFACYRVEVLSSGNYSFVLYFNIDFPLQSLPKKTFPCLPTFFPFAECELFWLSMQFSVSERPLCIPLLGEPQFSSEDCWSYHLSKKWDSDQCKRSSPCNKGVVVTCITIKITFSVLAADIF